MSLTKNEWCERIAQATQQKWATISNLLTSLRGNDRSWVNRSGRWPKWANEWIACFFWANRSFAHFWAKNEPFVQKTDERIPSPAYQLVQGKLESGSEFQSRFRILEKVHLQTDLDLQHCYTVHCTGCTLYFAGQHMYNFNLKKRGGIPTHNFF